MHACMCTLSASPCCSSAGWEWLWGPTARASQRILSGYVVFLKGQLLMRKTEVDSHGVILEYDVSKLWSVTFKWWQYYNLSTDTLFFRKKWNFSLWKYWSDLNKFILQDVWMSYQRWTVSPQLPVLHPQVGANIIQWWIEIQYFISWNVKPYKISSNMPLGVTWPVTVWIQLSSDICWMLSQ